MSVCKQKSILKKFIINILIYERKTKMKNTKKYLSLFLILAMIMSSITVFCVSATQLSDDTDVVVTYTEDVVIEHELVPVMASGCGFNSLNLLSNTKIAGYTVSMDLEHGGAGYNIHIKVNGTKYYYDMVNGCWPSGVPNKVAKSSVVADALAHGYDRIDAGWM